MLGYIARGLANAEIAREAFVSETTVKTHVARILMKLRLRDRVQAVVFAYEHGVVEPRCSIALTPRTRVRLVKFLYTSNEGMPIEAPMDASAAVSSRRSAQFSWRRDWSRPISSSVRWRSRRRRAIVSARSSWPSSASPGSSSPAFSPSSGRSSSGTDPPQDAPLRGRALPARRGARRAAVAPPDR